MGSSNESLEEDLNMLLLGAILGTLTFLVYFLTECTAKSVTTVTRVSKKRTPSKRNQSVVAQKSSNTSPQSQSKRRIKRAERDEFQAVLFDREDYLDNKDDDLESTSPKATPSRKALHLLYTALEKNLLLKHIDKEEQKFFIDHSIRGKFKTGAQINKQGDPGEFFYIIESGKVKIVINDKFITTLKEGNSFGELALLSGAPRSATVIATEECILWRLSRKDYRKEMARNSLDHANKTKESLRGVTILKNFPEPKLESLSRAVKKRNFRPGDIIIKRGQMGNCMFMISSGQVTVTDIGDNMRDVTLGPSQYFGERALETGELRKATVKAKTSCELLELERGAFDVYFGSLHDAMNEYHEARVLVGTEFFQFLKQGDVETTADAFSEVCFPSNKEITKQGVDNDSFYIIKEGIVSARITPPGRSEQEFMRLHEGQFFSLQSLLLDSKNLLGRSAAHPAAMETCVPLTNVTCWVLHRNDLKKITTPAFESSAKKAYDARSAMIQAVSTVVVSKDKLVIHNTLGRGTFGTVKLVQDPKTKNVFAMKILDKDRVIKYEQQDNVMNEKCIMLTCNHPFILKLHNTYKDDFNLYFLLEYCRGGELFSVIHKEREDGICAEHARFYTSCIILALCYLLDRGVKYRDLKPENILIDSMGYAKIVDFGFAKHSTHLSFTLCGTPEYMAPEIILGRGYDQTIDWWALGILIYECISGTTPFEAVNQEEICRKIIQGQIKFPKSAPFDDHSKNLISRLLNKKPQDRLTNGPSRGTAVKNHDWYHSVDWNSTLSKTVKPPWVPKCKNALDTKHFSAVDEAETGKKKWRDPAPGWDLDF